MEKKELRVDRIEDGVAIAYAADGTEYFMCQRIADLQESDILLAFVNQDGMVVDVTVRRKETEEVKQTLRNRLQSLFDR